MLTPIRARPRSNLRVISVRGSPNTIGGVPQLGSVRIYDVTPAGIGGALSALLVGETWRPGGRAGEFMQGGRSGGRPAVIVGAPYGNGTGLDNGSAYVLELD